MDFAVTVLLTCANAARYVDDPRVNLDGYDSRSSGWKYFEVVMRLRKSILAPATLADLQSLSVRRFLFASRSLYLFEGVRD